MTDNWQTLVRAMLKAGCGALASKGIIDGSEVETIVSAVVFLASVLWGIYEKKSIAKNASQTVATNLNTPTETK